MRMLFPSLMVILLLSACSSIGKIENESVSQLPEGPERYSMINFSQQHDTGDTLLLLAFSGGGTRAAALSYGVLEELRDTHYQLDGKEISLLDEVDRISSVSGGSFTSAYYGLFGDQIFDDYKEVFLYKDVQGALTRGVFEVFGLIGRTFSSTSRTEVAIDYYDKNIFQGKTFADLQQTDGPFILINASDLNSQNQFSFVQPLFDFLCSDLSQFKVARAVAASSAVPVLFAPILIERHENCHFEKPVWLTNAEQKAIQDGNQRLATSVRALDYYLDNDNPPYVTLVDGGVTDNLGLRAILASISLIGVQAKYDLLYKDKEPPKKMVIIVVNASTDTKSDIGTTRTLPSMGETMSAVTDMQLHLYNTETSSLLKEKLMQWAKTVSTDEHPLTPYFINLDVTGIQDPQDRLFFNGVPTSFTLEKEDADKLIVLAKDMLRHHPEYQKLLHQLDANN